MIRRTRSHVSAAVFLIATTVLTAACASSGAGAPVAEARRKAAGAEVSVVGTVTVPSGVIDAGFALQDGSAGIYVAPADTTVRHAVGERVRATGRLGDNHGLLTMTDARVEPLGRGDAPVPRRVRTGEVGEATEGLLVEATGHVTGPVVDDRPYGWKITIDDGSGPLLVFVPVGARMDVSGIRAGERLRAAGFSGQYDDHAEILPRSQADLEVLR